MKRYEFWVHRVGEKYLIRLDESNCVTGICGPLRQADIPVANRQYYPYDTRPKPIAWVRVHVAEFRCADASPA